MSYTFPLERETKAALLIKETIAAAGQGDDEELLHDCIEGETGLLEQIDLLLMRGADLASMMTAIDMQLKELQARKQRFKIADDTLRRLLFGVMTTVELPKLERPVATLSIRAGGTKVAVHDEDELPDEFFKVERSPSLSTIKQAIDEGREVPGASLVRGEPSLMIKRS